MKTIHLLSASVLMLFFFLSLNARGQDKTYAIDLSKPEGKTQEVNLSSIAADINYIALETTPDSYITSVFNVIKTDKNLLILDDTDMERKRLLIFDLNGSFKAQIHSVGKGPGEYVGISDVAYDPVNLYITILDAFQKKVLQYSLSGKFIRETLVENRPQNLCYIEPGYFVIISPLQMVKPAQDGKFYNIIVYDRNFTVKKRIASPVKSAVSVDSPYFFVGGVFNYENRLRYKQPFVDDIYTLDNNLNYKVFCRMDFGKYRMPESVYASTESSHNRPSHYREFHSLIESRDFFFIKYGSTGKTPVCLLNKHNGLMSYVSLGIEKVGFGNDFDGSMAFWPRSSSGPDELINYFNAIDLIDYCDKNHVRKFKSKFPAQQKKLFNLLDKLDQESNPVIQIVTLKKN